MVQAGATAFYDVNEFSNTLYGISSYQIFDQGCLTTTGDAAAFVSAANIIPTLSAGKLKALPADVETLTTLHFCIKITDDSGYGYFETLDNLSLEVLQVESCEDALSISSSISPETV